MLGSTTVHWSRIAKGSLPARTLPRAASTGASLRAGSKLPTDAFSELLLECDATKVTRLFWTLTISTLAWKLAQQKPGIISLAAPHGQYVLQAVRSSHRVRSSGSLVF